MKYKSIENSGFLCYTFFNNKMFRNAKMPHRRQIMGKQTKNVITRASIKEDLISLNTANLRFYSIILAAALLLFLPIDFALIGGVWTTSNIMLLFKLLFSFVLLFANAPIWIIVIFLIFDLIDRRKIKHDEFYVVTRSLICKKETIDNRFKIRYFIDRRIPSKLVKKLCFTDFEAYDVISAVFDLASNGDEFYLVHLKNKKIVELVYDVKIYEYRLDNDGVS